MRLRFLWYEERWYAGKITSKKIRHWEIDNDSATQWIQMPFDSATKTLEEYTK